MVSARYIPPGVYVLSLAQNFTVFNEFRQHTQQIFALSSAFREASMMETHFSILNLCPENRVHIRLCGSFLIKFALPLRRA
jgi:hypothetical protein